MKAWLKLFRVVNLPTVPGDVLAGAASMMLAADRYSLKTVMWTAVASVFIYMFGLVDNDIVGAKTDAGRPIADGEISFGAANVARQMCITAMIAVAVLASVPIEWLPVSALLLVACAAYNRTKSVVLMGLCRGLNVGCGAAVVYAGADRIWLDWRLLVPFAVAAVFSIYIAAVTKYSEGEENDPARKRRVGVLIGSHIYLQLITLIVFAILVPSTTPLMVGGAILLVALRILKHTLPHVSAS